MESRFMDSWPRDSGSRNLSLRAGRVRYALRKVNNKRMLARTSDGGTWETTVDQLWSHFNRPAILP